MIEMIKENKSVKNFPNSRNVPKLRFSKFSDEWENKKLGDLMTFKVTNSYSRDNLNYESGSIKNIHYGDIHTKFQTLFNLEKENVPYVNEDISLNRISEDFYCQEGDIIFADASEDLNDVGKSIEITNLNGEKLLSGLHTLLARPQKNTFSKGFLGYLLKSDFVRNQIKREAQGSKVLSINVSRISNIHLSFPSISEQQKISESLSLLDERIQTQKKIIEQLETLMNTSREKIFSQKLRFKDEHGNYFPEWKLNKLGNLGMFFSGGTPLTSNRKYYQGNIPFIKSGEINSVETEQFISEDALKNSSAKMVNVGDILYALYGATSGEVGMSKLNGAINQAILCIRTELDNLFLLNYLKFNKKNILNTYLQGGQGNLSSEIIKSLLTPIPDSNEQVKIANFLSSIQEKIETEKQILEKLELQKKFLLSNLFI